MEEAAHADDATLQRDELAVRSTTTRARFAMVKPATKWLRGLLRAGKAQQRTASKLAKVLFGPVPAKPTPKPKSHAIKVTRGNRYRRKLSRRVLELDGGGDVHVPALPIPRRDA